MRAMVAILFVQKSSSASVGGRVRGLLRSPPKLTVQWKLRARRANQRSALSPCDSALYAQERRDHVTKGRRTSLHRAVNLGERTNEYGVGTWSACVLSSACCGTGSGGGSSGQLWRGCDGRRRLAEELTFAKSSRCRRVCVSCTPYVVLNLLRV